MTVDTLISALAAATLFAMMLAIGLTVRLSELKATASNVRLLRRAGRANYVAVSTGFCGSGVALAGCRKCIAEWRANA